MEAIAALGLGLLAVMAVGYFLPFLIALVRGHANTFAIFVLNLLAGWTLVGWLVLAAWALVGAREREA